MKRVFNSLIKRPIKNYNAHERSQKYIEKREKTLAKPTDGDLDLSSITAPKHKSSLEHLDRLRKEHPEFLEEQKKKDEQLLKNMSGMVVNPERFSEIAHKPLAKPTKPIVYDTEFGYKEPDSVPEGKCTIRQAVHFITEHAKDPHTYTAAHIAREYKLDEERVTKVLKHFQTLQVKYVKDPTKYDAGVETVTPQKLINTKMQEPDK